MMTRKHPEAKCEECPLASKPCAPTLKGSNPKAAIISRSPGYHEGIAGKPFSGPSGKVLDHLLKMNGLQRKDVLVTNVVLCAPDKGKVPPEAIAACADRLRGEIAGIPLVVACGSEAVNLVIGRGAIDRYRGKRIERGGKIYVATNNPALVLRDDSTFPNLKRDFRRAFNPLPPPTLPKVEVIENRDRAIALLKDIPPGLVSCDIESRGGLTHKATLISIQFAVHGTLASVLGEREGLWNDASFIDDHLRPFLESEHHRFIWHGGKFDTKILRHTYGINARVDEDTMLLSYALDERSGGDASQGVHGLDYLLMDTFGWPDYCPPSVQKAKKTGVVEDYDAFYKYAGYDVAGTYQLFEEQVPRCKAQDGLWGSYENLIEYNELLIQMELEGMPYDVPRASDVYEFEVAPELKKIREQMTAQVGRPILASSPTQIAALLYDEWGVKHEMQKRPDMEHSVDDSARKEILAGRFTFAGAQTPQRRGNMVSMVDAPDKDERTAFIQSFVEKYDRFQELFKQSSTYLTKMIERAEQDPEHRVYTQLNLHGTNSGRLSSSKPNLQNITRTKPGLPDIRRLFKAPDGWLVVQADYSQAELRCIAQLSQDPLLCKVYYDGLDLHNETARRFYGENFTPEQRSTSKNVNFGVFYRQSAATFQEKHNIPEKEAQKYIDWVWSTFTGVKEWEESLEATIRSKGYIQSPFGRRRRFHLLTRENVQAAFREGINFPPQSIASDLTLTAAVRINRQMDRSWGRLVLSVHDSILAFVRPKYVERYSEICRTSMESVPRDVLGWDLPFKADIGVGPTWGEAK